MSLERKFLVEVNSYDDVLGAVTEYFSTGTGYTTKPSHTPASTVYLPLVLDAGSVQEYLFDDRKTTGRTLASAATILLNNGSRRLDYMLDRGYDGRDVLIKEVTAENQNPADMPVRFRGIVQSIDFSNRTIRLNIRSPYFSVFTSRFQTFKYAGTNNGSSIYLEGTPESLMDTPKPKLIGNGATGNMPAILVDRANEIFQLSSDPVAEITNVYVGRAVITPGTEYTSLSAFVTAATGVVSAGTYIIYRGSYAFAEGTNERGCFIAFGTTPDKQVTFDAIEGWKNLFLYSADFSNAAWTLNHVTITSAGAGSAPDGVQTAQYAEKTATGGANVRQDVTTVSGRYYTVSIFAEADTLDALAIRATGSGVRAEVEFDLTDGSTNVVTNNVTDSAKLNATCTEVATGVYRCSLTFDANNTSTQLRFYPQNSSATTAGRIIIHGAMLEEGVYEVGPYNPTTSAAAYNHSAACNLWKIMKSAGFSLCPVCLITANIDDNSPTFIYQDNSEVTLDNIIEPIAESAKLFLLNTTTGAFKVGRLKVPTSGEIVQNFDSRVLFDGSNDVKVRIISPADIGNGIPIYTCAVKYEKNYTIQSESDVYGVSADAPNLNELPFISQEFRTQTDTTASTLVKHLNALERVIDTALTEEADALARATYELDLYDQIRLTIEIDVPTRYGFAVNLGDVIQVENRIYRIIGRQIRFPNAQGSGSSLVTLQGWGGVKV